MEGAFVCVIGRAHIRQWCEPLKKCQSGRKKKGKKKKRRGKPSRRLVTGTKDQRTLPRSVLQRWKRMKLILIKSQVIKVL